MDWQEAYTQLMTALFKLSEEKQHLLLTAKSFALAISMLTNGSNEEVVVGYCAAAYQIEKVSRL